MAATDGMYWGMLVLVKTCWMLLQSEGVGLSPRGIGPWPWVPRKSQATQAPSKEWSATVPAHSLVIAATSGVRTASVMFCPLPQALCLALAVAEAYASPSGTVNHSV